MARNSKITKILTALFFMLIISVSSFAQSHEGGIEFSITEWNTGLLEPGIIVEQVVGVVNNTGEAVRVELVSTCSCMTTDVETLELVPKASGSFKVFLDTSDDRGEFEKLLIIMTDSEAMPKGFFVVSGTVKTAPEAESLPQGPDPGDKPKLPDSSLKVPLYYYTPGCKSCNKFLKDSEIPIDKRDITNAEYFEELQHMLSLRCSSLREIPVLITETDVFQGEAEVVSGYKDLIERADIEGPSTAGSLFGNQDTAQEGRGSAAVNISIPAVIAAGLLDGVNPCAFTTLIFLLSALSVAGRSRRETLIIGIFFTLSVFVTYYLIGLGFFKIIRLAASFELISRIIRWLLFGVLILFSVLSFYDYSKIRAGKASEILLQLPDSVKRRMHSSIRSYSKSAAIAGSSIVMGFLISIFELGCTGQIYFPTITYIIQTDKTASGFMYLGLYNIAFILPLAAVFVVVYLGVTSKKITRRFQENLGIIKILTGLLFLGFAALMILL